MDYPDDYDEEEEDFTDWFNEQTLNDPCSVCGPWCEHWGGDGLCDLEIEALAQETAEFQENYTHAGMFCPRCARLLTLYDIPADELWVWPGGFSKIIGLNIYGAAGVPKGVVHQWENVYHIWIGEWNIREEKLIRLMGSGLPSHLVE